MLLFSYIFSIFVLPNRFGRIEKEGFVPHAS
jgi:hypothetical protein